MDELVISPDDEGLDQDQGPQKAKILIIDDEEVLARPFAIALRFEGYEVEQLSDPTQAEPAVKKIWPDLIILDLLMPAMDGFEVLKRIKGFGYHNPVLIFTNSPDDVGLDKAMALGAYGYFEKAKHTPIELVGQVKSILPPTKL